MAREKNDESRDQGSNQVTEKTTLVVARLQSVKNWVPPFNPLTLELNPSVQRCLTRFF
jgi:hypothetical protein